MNATPSSPGSTIAARSALQSDGTFTIPAVTPDRKDVPGYVGTLSTDEVKDANRRAGLFYFEPDTMRFFASRVASVAFYASNAPRVAYFVTSEQFRPSRGLPLPRKYSVRVCDLDTGAIDTFAESFQEFETSATATTAAKRAAYLAAFMAEGWTSCPTTNGRDLETWEALAKHAQHRANVAKEAAAEAAKVKPAVVGSLECLSSLADTYGNCYFALRYTDHATGRKACGTVSGGESNVRSALSRLGEPGTVSYRWDAMKIRAFNAETRGWPYAGCTGEDLAAFIRAELAKG